MDIENFVFSVSQVTDLLKDIIETSFQEIKIEGEISNWRPSAAGHIYFTLKDSNAQIKAVMFKGAAHKIKSKLKDGDKVCCSGSLSVYAPQGCYQIIVTSIEPVGKGDILQILEERKIRFAEEGLFDEENKKPLPGLPEILGVITSPTGAAIKDILNIAKRRNPKVNIIIFPAVVQGNEAAESIEKMIHIANYYKMCDTLILGRGGGSIEDLLPFSEENVVRAVAASEIPVISAVGHEIDWALCDYAADKRASTPSAAAEMAVPLLSDIQQELNFYKSELYSSIKQKIDNNRLILKSFNPESLEIRLRNIQQPLLNKYSTSKENLIKNIQEKINAFRLKISNNITVMENADPRAILKRGYSIVTDKSGNIIKDSAGIKKDSEIKITLGNGELEAKVLNAN